MHQKNHSGIRLRSRDESATGSAAWLLQIVVSLLALGAEVLIFAELSGFQQPQAVAILAATGAFLCVFYGLLTKFERQGWFFLVVLLAMLAVCLIYRQALLAGYCAFRGQLSDILTAGTGWVLPALEAPEWDATMAMWLFASLCGATMGLISCFFTALVPGALAVFLPGAAMAGMYLLGCTESLVWLLAVLAVSGLLLLYSGWKRNAAIAPVLVTWVSCAVVFCGLLVCLSGLNGWAEQVTTRVHQALHQYRYETEYTVLPEGDLSNAPVENGDIQPGLVVTMSRAEAMYLRSFAGCTFEDNRWTAISNQRLCEEKELLYWLNQSAFSLNAQFEGASETLGLETGTVTVENIGGCSAYLYVPYNLCDGAYLSAENLNPDIVESDGSRSYSYAVVPGGVETLSWTLDELQNSGDASVSQYRQAESAYRAFVYNNYLAVPEEVETQLQKSWDAIEKAYGNVLTWEQAQKCVLAYLESFPDDRLLEDWAGTSYQYATVAVLTLRHFGIPARYAEGYMIPQEMAEADVSLSVDSSYAGAWAEVYQDGIGWLPMALTPGMEEEDATRETVQKPRETAEDPEDQDEEEEIPEDDPSGQQAPEGNIVAVMENILLLLLLLLLLLILILVCRRQYRRRKITQRFRLENTKDAVGWIFADTALLLESMGLSRNNGSMHTLCEPAKERFGEEYERALRGNIRLNERALFSSRELTEDCRKTMLDFRLDTLRHLKKETKWHRKLWLKWIRCLY